METDRRTECKYRALLVIYVLKRDRRDESIAVVNPLITQVLVSRVFDVPVLRNGSLVLDLGLHIYDRGARVLIWHHITRS